MTVFVALDEVEYQVPDIEGPTPHSTVVLPMQRLLVLSGAAGDRPCQACLPPLPRAPVAPGFKDKTRYTPYMSPKNQITHMTTNRGNIKRQCL